MAILQQKETDYVSYLGWYGKCGITSANDILDLASTDFIHAVFKTNQGGVKSYTAGTPEFLQAVKTLEPGNAYWITLKPGTQTIELSNFSISDSENSSFDGDPSMISDCSSTSVDPTPISAPTPTPTQTPTQTQTPTPTPEPVVAKKIKLPVIIYGWDTGNTDTSLHFTSNKLQFENGSKRYCTFQDIDDMFNGTNYSWPALSGSKGVTGSVKEYYKSISFGQLDVEFVILPAGTTSKPSSNNPNDHAYLINDDWKKYGEYKNGSNNGHRNDRYRDIHAQFQRMFSKARLNLKMQGEDYDKMFPASAPLTFVQAGFSASGVSGTNRYNFIWAHKWSFYYSGRWRTYNVNPFLESMTGRDDQTKAAISTIGVIVHETLHAFGLPDLYDPTGAGTGINKLSVLASGSYGNASYTSAYLPSYALSWTRNYMVKNKLFETQNVEIRETTTNIEIKSTLDENKMYRIHHPTKSDCWWVELRTKNSEGKSGVNFDKLIMEAGLAITHEGNSGGASSNNGTRTPANRRGETGYHITLEQQDGKFASQHGQRSISNDLYKPGHEISPYTIPSTVSRDGTPSGIKIHNITNTSNNTMKFDVTFLDEPNYKIQGVGYNFENTSHAESSTNRTILKKNTYGANIIATVTTSQIADGTKIFMTAHGDSGSKSLGYGVVNNNKCEITTSTSDFTNKLRASSTPRPGHVNFKVDPDSNYGDAFVWNDYIRVTY